MNFFQSLVLGFIQGVTEFLPISSMAHLVLVPWFLDWYEPGLAHDISLHVGTLAALLYYFRSDWVKLALGFSSLVRGGHSGGNPHGRLAVYLVVATVPGALAGLLLEGYASSVLREPLVIAFSLGFFGVCLYVADRVFVKRKAIGEMTLFDGVLIGLFQALAIAPGVSRSGITITGALLRNYRRDEAARFSFLLGAPIIAGAGILEARHMTLSAVLTPEFAGGFVASALFGFLSIKYLIRYVQARDYTVFAVYRVLLAAVILYLYLH